MRNTQHLRQILFEIGIFVLLLLILLFVFGTLRPAAIPSGQVDVPTPVPAQTAENPVDVAGGSTENPYPLPDPTQVELPGLSTEDPYPPPEPDKKQPKRLPEKVKKLLPLMDKVKEKTKAIMLDEGKIWQVSKDSQPEILIEDIDNVSIIYGWNYDGTKILFGRGSFPYREGGTETTELWLYDTNTKILSKLGASQTVWTASWSPTDDRIAICESGDKLTVVNVSGETFNTLENILCEFNWSPDGQAIAILYYTPEMIFEDYKTANLGIWRLTDNRVDALFDTPGEYHSQPIWSMDGEKILFARVFIDPDKQSQSGIYLANVGTGQVSYLEGTLIPSRNMIRSSHADLVSYQLVKDLYIMDFEGRLRSIGKGNYMIWLPDGECVIYQTEEGSLDSVEVGGNKAEKAEGGQGEIRTLTYQDEYIFFQEGVE